MKILLFVNIGNAFSSAFMLYHGIPALSVYYLVLSAIGFAVWILGRRNLV